MNNYIKELRKSLFQAIQIQREITETIDKLEKALNNNGKLVLVSDDEKEPA